MSKVLRDEARCSLISAWEQSPAGQYALQRKQALLLHLISDWKQRKQSILELGCGSGYFQKAFAQAGFDVAGLECHPRLLQQARQRLGSRAELYYGQVDCLPFQDNEFDYTAALMLLPFCLRPDQVLAEALRVSKKGLLLGALNRYSLYGFNAAWSKRLIKGNGAWRKELTWWTWPELHRFLRQYREAARIKARSVLPGPMWSWRPNSLWDKLNNRFYPPGLGAILLVRLDRTRPRTGTPILAWVKQPRTIPS